MAKKAKDTTSIGFEEKIWKAADILRGNLSASQYEGVVLGLIFLKYISDRFDQKFQELQGDDYADPEDKDEYTRRQHLFRAAGGALEQDQRGCPQARDRRSDRRRAQRYRA